MMRTYRLGHLSNRDLVAGVKRLLADERTRTAEILAHLAEIDQRRLYLDHGCSSLFVYCTTVLGLSESCAYKRIEVARAARKLPAIYERIARGELHVSGVKLLVPYLTESNHRALLDAASGKTCKQIELLIAERFPRPDVPARITTLPTRGNDHLGSSERAAPSSEPAAPLALTAGAGAHRETENAAPEVAARPVESAAPAPVVPPVRRQVVEPLAPRRYRVEMTIGQETRDKLEHARALMRHQVPDGDVAAIVDRALDTLIAQLEKRKLGATDRPRAARPCKEDSRHIPNAVKRAVWERDGGQCTFVGDSGRRCEERGFLQFDHLVPWARGGEATVENTRLLCAAHNRHAAERIGLHRPAKRDGSITGHIPGAHDERLPGHNPTILAGASQCSAAPNPAG